MTKKITIVDYKCGNIYSLKNILKKLDYEVKGTILGQLPIIKRITFYTRYGDYLGRIGILLFLLYFFIAASGRLKLDKKNY